VDYEEALMARVAWFYYIEGLTQQQISDRLNITRIRVIRLLDKARQTGMIRFSLRRGNEKRMELEQALISSFGLKDAFLAPAPRTSEETNGNVAEAASMYISERLTPSSVINMGYGDTPSRILNRLATIAEDPLTCVSLTGGVSYYLPDAQSNIFNAKLRLIPAPLLASSREMAEAFLQESGVQELSRMISLAQMSVVGIGSLHEDATIFRTGVLNANDRLYLTMRGAAGDVLCHFIDGEGNLINSPIEERLISTSMDKLRSLKNVIGVAAGAEKVTAIRAVLRGGILDTLITDEPTAELVLGSA